MRKLFVLVIGSIFFYSTTSAQDKLLVAEGTAPNLYITHTIAPKENYYSVGRMYNYSPKDLAVYNNLPFDKGLTLGETIKIPLAANNFSQGEAANANEVLVPVYHIMQPKEGLYRISVNYNKVPLDVLKQWNHLSGDAVSTGSKLIIGYLKVLKDQSPLASQAMNVTPTIAVAKEPAEKPAKKTKAEIKAEKEQSAKTENTEVQPKPTPPVVPEKTQEVNTASTKSTIDFNGGKFKSNYNDQVKKGSLVSESGSAAIFKTTSGWQDGKYYCFHNTALPGTIIKVTNNANGKSVYAKVLDIIPDIKQNTGLLLRISNSAADELGAGESKFECSITYVK